MRLTLLALTAIAALLAAFRGASGQTEGLLAALFDTQGMTLFLAVAAALGAFFSRPSVHVPTFLRIMSGLCCSVRAVTAAPRSRCS